MTKFKNVSHRKSAIGVAIASLFAVSAYSGAASATAKITLQKSVTVASSACAAGTVETMTVGGGTQMRYCYVLRNRSTAGENLYNVKLLEKNGTTGTSDDVTVNFNSITGLSDLDGDGRSDDLAPGAAATATMVVTMSNPGTYAGPAFAYADAFSGGAQSISARNGATIIVDQDKMRSMVVRKTVVEASQQCPGSVALNSVYSGDSVKYCYEVENLGDFDIEDLRLWDNLGSSGSASTMTLTGLQDIDGDGDIGDLMPGAIATGESVQPITQVGGSVILATATAKSENMLKRAATRVTVATGARGACSVQMTAAPVGSACPAGSAMEVTGTNAQFCYRVTNTGSTPLSNITITDRGHGNPTVTTLAALAAGASSSWYPRANALFSGRYDDHIGEASAEDAFGNPVACTADGATAVKYGDTSPPSPDVFLDKKISLNGICTVAQNNGAPPVLYDEVTVPSGTKVWYCYRMRNNLAVKWPYNNGTVPDGQLTDPQFPGEELYHFKLNIWATSELTASKGPIVVDETLHTTSSLRVSTLTPNAYLHDSATVRVEKGNLRITKSGQTSALDTRVSKRINYNLVVDNTGDALMRRATITDKLSNLVTFVSAQGCTYNSAAHEVKCNLGNIGGGAQRVRTIEVDSKIRFGEISNTACVSSLYPETTGADNCSTQRTRVHAGTTRNREFWENNEMEMRQCLANNGNILGVGFTTLKNETRDNEVDAFSLPGTNSSLIGDVGRQKDTAIKLSLGLLNADDLRLIGNKPRTTQATWCLRAAKELAAATCNIKHFGARNVINLASMRVLVRQSCRHTGSATVRNSRIKSLKSYRGRMKRFNESGMTVTAPAVDAANPLTLRTDDPTDRKD